jgi:hypothetical protein
MKTQLGILAKVFGVAFMVLSLWQWIAVDYPDFNPFRPGGIFAPGTISQISNWVFVTVLWTIGWGLFKFGRLKLSDSPAEEKQS